MMRRIAAIAAICVTLSAACPAGAQAVDGPPLPDIRVTRSPVLGSSELDPLFHDPGLYAPEPLPIEAGAALDALVMDRIPRATLLGPATPDRGMLNRIERGGAGRLARRIGGDEVVLPVWRLRLGGRR